MNKDTERTLDNVFEIASSEVSDEPTIAIVPAVEVLPAPVAAPIEETENELQAREDFQFSRGALKAVAVEAQNTLHRSVDVATQTDTPRSFEAVAVMIRATLDSHKELHDLHEKAAKMRAMKTTTPAATVNVDKGIVFNGSTADLLKLIDPSRK
jgi:hypothetical protein